MPNNKPITDAELAELRRLHAALGAEPIERDHEGTGWIRPDGDAELGNWRIARFAWANESDAVLAIFNAFPALLARLAEAERERDELECQVEELEANAIEYEKDCTKALCGLARDLDYEWDGDGATADELREFIRGLLSERGISKALADRDAQQRREGAAEWLRGYIIAVKVENPIAETVWIAALEQAAKRLREGK